MVRDYAAANAQPQSADDGQPLDLRSSTANLTQELAQLLAQSIAQGQGSKSASGAAATGAQFSNLVALVTTATQTQRSHQPSFRDGLSSLSYARPAQPPAPPPMLAPVPSLVSVPATGLMPPPSGGLMPAPSSGLLVSEPHDEEPMPIPSTWRQPTLGDDEKWYRQQLGAAGLGLLAGLVVVVPAVLWLSGFLGGSQTKAVPRQHEASGPSVKVADVKQVPVKVASANLVAPPVEQAPPRYVPPPPQARAPVQSPAPVVVAVPAPRSVEPVRSRADELLVQAKRRIDSGDITGARDILQAPEMATSAAMSFLLAETYDPNMLASWQTRNVTANPERARSLYQKARELGDGRAQQRLDWLMAN